MMNFTAFNQNFVYGKIEAHIAFLPTIHVIGKSRNTVSYEARELILTSLTKNNHQDISRVGQS